MVLLLKNGIWKLVLPIILVAYVPSILAGPLQLVSVRDLSQAAPAGGNGGSGSPIVTPDGRYVLFASSANNLTRTTNNGFVPAQTLARLNVFVRDRINGTTALVSMNQSGTGGGNGDSQPDGISSDGRYVLFEGSASDLVAGDVNNATDLFLRDLTLETTTLVSVGTDGASGNGASFGGVMTPDGRYVAFASAATNLVTADTNGIIDVFLRDTVSGQTRLVSAGARNPTPTIPGIGSANPQITPDGNCVAFYSTATNLVAGVTNSGDIYVRALNTGTTYWASTNARALALSILGQTNAISYNHQLSTNGTYVAFEASLPASTSGLILRYNLLTGLTDVANTNAATAPSGFESAAHDLDLTPDGRFIAFVANTNTSDTCILQWDGLSGSSILISSNLSGGVTAGTFADWPVMDASGQNVAFVSSDANLTTNNVFGKYDLYVRNVSAGTTLEVDAAASGPAAGVSPAMVPAMSASGQMLAFEEQLDGNLTPNDRNHVPDVFARVFSATTNELISIHDPSLPSLTPNGGSFPMGASASSNGLFVVFSSDADNLVPNDTNGWRDVFVRDVAHGSNILVSVSADGVSSGNGMSTTPSMSADGRYVAFTSAATNLVPGDTNAATDIFVRDLLAGTNELISAGTNAGSFGNLASYSPTISPDGRYVLFHSLAYNLAPGLVGSQSSITENVLIRDRQLHTNYSLTMMPLAGGTGLPASTTGRYTAYYGSLNASLPDHLYVWDSLLAKRILTNTVDTSYVGLTISSNGQWLAYLNSSSQLRLLNVTSNTLVTIATGGFPQAGGSSFSADGRYLAYTTTSSNSPSDNNGLADIYVYDTTLATNILISHCFNSFNSPNGLSDRPLISPDGRFVAYRSTASNIIPGDGNGVADLFLYDRLSGTISLVSVGQTGSAFADSQTLAAYFSPDSKTLFFQSAASDLVTSDYNGLDDVYSLNLYPPLDAGGSNLLSGFVVQILSGANSTNAGQIGPVIAWPAIPGKAYQVLFKNDLSNANWQILSGSLSYVGTNGYAFDLAPVAGRRFYRVSLTN